MSRITDDKDLLIQINNVVVGAMFDLMGWLTTRDERLVLSSSDNAGPAADAVVEFLKKRSIQLFNPNIQNWSQVIKIDDDKMTSYKDLPEGFYLLSNDKEPNVSLVKLYKCDDFKDELHIAFGPWDGTAIMPISELVETSVLTPVQIFKSDTPCDDLETVLNPDFKKSVKPDVVNETVSEG